jgi:hypothetical protein
MREVLYGRQIPDTAIVSEARQACVWLDWEPTDRNELVSERPCAYAPANGGGITEPLYICGYLGGHI